MHIEHIFNAIFSVKLENMKHKQQHVYCKSRILCRRVGQKVFIFSIIDKILFNVPISLIFGHNTKNNKSKLLYYIRGLQAEVS